MSEVGEGRGGRAFVSFSLLIPPITVVLVQRHRTLMLGTYMYCPLVDDGDGDHSSSQCSVLYSIASVSPQKNSEAVTVIVSVLNVSKLRLKRLGNVTEF